MKENEYAFHHLKLHYKEMFFSKNPDYRDESEYRILVLTKMRKYDYIEIGDSLQGLIVGDKCPDVYYPLIEAFGEKYNCPCRELHWSNWEPHLLLLKENIT